MKMYTHAGNTTIDDLVDEDASLSDDPAVESVVGEPVAAPVADPVADPVAAFDHTDEFPLDEYFKGFLHLHFGDSFLLTVERNTRVH